MTIFLLGVVVEADAQRRSSKSRNSDRSERSSRSSRNRDADTEKISINDRLFYEIPIGNIGFNGGFSISLKPTVGYKFSERFGVGVGLRSFYYFLNNPNINGEDASLFLFGPSTFARFKVTQDIYLQAGYDYNSYKYDEVRQQASLTADRTWFGSPMIGAGYSSGYGPWKYGLQLLFMVDDDVRNRENSAVDYWINFSYNF